MLKVNIDKKIDLPIIGIPFFARFPITVKFEPKYLVPKEQIRILMKSVDNQYLNYSY